MENTRLLFPARNWRILLVRGLAAIGVSGAAFAYRDTGMLSIAWLIGFWAIAVGILFVLLAFCLRNAGR